MESWQRVRVKKLQNACAFLSLLLKTILFNPRPDTPRLKQTACNERDKPSILQKTKRQTGGEFIWRDLRSYVTPSEKKERNPCYLSVKWTSKESIQLRKTHNEFLSILKINIIKFNFQNKLLTQTLWLKSQLHLHRDVLPPADCKQS